MNVDDGEPYKCCSVAMTQEVNYGPLNPLISSVVLINSTYICSIDGTFVVGGREKEGKRERGGGFFFCGIYFF